MKYAQTGKLADPRVDGFVSGLIGALLSALFLYLNTYLSVVDVPTDLTLYVPTMIVVLRTIEGFVERWRLQKFAEQPLEFE